MSLASQRCPTWEDVDTVVAHELKTHECVMKLKTSERRLFAFVAIYSYIYGFMTTRNDRNSYEWCPGSAAKNLLSGVAGIIRVMQKRVKRYEAALDRLSVDRIKNRFADFGTELLASRHIEITDPDKRIWQRLYEKGITPDKVVSSYEKVKHLLPNEAIANYEHRTGPIPASMMLLHDNRAETACRNNCYIAPTEMERLTKMSARAFYDKYIRSDIMVAKSNKLSETFSEQFEVLPGTCMRVPRRLERYFNAEMGHAAKNGSRFPSNHIRCLVFAYSVSEIFGSAFMGAQVYLKGFSASAFEACRSGDVSESSYSRLKDLLKNRKLLTPVAAEKEEDSTNANVFPRVMKNVEAPQARHDIRSVLAKTSRYSPDRKEKMAVAMMRSPVAEHEREGTMATWLGLMISKQLGRRVCPLYALLLLINWAAHQQQKQLLYQKPGSGSMDANKSFRYNNDIEECLKRISTSIGLTFSNDWGIVMPVVGFGSGMTRTKMRQYAIHVIRNYVQALMKSGRVVKEPHTPPSKGCTLENIVAGFFKNNGILKNGAGSKDNASDAEKEAVDSMMGQEFVPCEERRKVHEEEYTRALMTRLRLKFRFGVCGYQHPLTAKSDKRTLVMSQLLKHRLIYTQRETAAALNWNRMVQFLFPHHASLPGVPKPRVPEDQKGLREEQQPRKEENVYQHQLRDYCGPYAKFATARLTGLNRAFIESASTALRRALPCERVLDDVCIKFNADMLTLGKKPDTILRTKAGLIIGEHAKRALEMAHHIAGNYEECRKVNSTHVSDIATQLDVGEMAISLAQRCVTAKEHANEYNTGRPFLPSTGRFEPIPLFGIDNPIFPAKNSYKDETATRCNDPESSFWLKETKDVLADGLVSRGILSLPKLSKSDNHNTILSSKDNHCMAFLKRLRRVNKKELASDKPRKTDPTPWSSKNTGQSGRSSTEFSPNSIIVISMEPEENQDETKKESSESAVNSADGEYYFHVGGENDIFLAGVETQRAMAQNDILYPESNVTTINGETVDMMLAPDISPMYRHGGKPAVITLKHSTCNKPKTVIK